jgi:6-pyruvoyltetrahydropterin/6-carboxytetrahydropterin synthase
MDIDKLVEQLFYSVTVRGHFDAAHYLPNYKGKCANMHGHRWVVEVTVHHTKGSGVFEGGFVIDFKLLKEALNEVLDQLDHKVLNEVLTDIVPTAELIAYWVLREMAFYIEGVEGVGDTGYEVYQVRVCESPNCWATVTRLSCC